MRTSSPLRYHLNLSAFGDAQLRVAGSFRRERMSLGCSVMIGGPSEKKERKISLQYALHLFSQKD